jgi:hypothetical protein
MTTNMHELAIIGFGPPDERHDPSGHSQGALGYSVGQVGGPNYCLQWSQVCTIGLDGREEEGGQHVIDRPGGYVGRLVAFVDMKVGELWKNDNTLLEINTGNGKPNAFVVAATGKKSFNDGTWKR